MSERAGVRLRIVGDAGGTVGDRNHERRRMWLHGGQEWSARFVLLRPLGAGGGAEVWLAEDRQAGRRVALKFLASALTHDAGALAALRREYALVRALEHPNILRVYGVHESAGRAWIAMQYAPGGDLRTLRGAHPAAIVHSASLVAAALAYAHRSGVVHRDVKPSNVLTGEEGAPLLADFGIALAAAASPGVGAGRGSPYNMSPQQLDGAPASPADDVYGLGAMLYELFTGYPPFYAQATPRRIRSEPPPPLMSAPPAVAGLIGRMLAKSADERPQMQSVERELAAALGALPDSESMARSKMSSEQKTSSTRIEPPAFRPPPGQGEPLRSEWRRTPAAGETQRRRVGFGRSAGVTAIVVGLLGVVFVFVGLPRWVGDHGDRAAAQYRPAASAPLDSPASPSQQQRPAAAGQIDFAALARAKQRAEEMRAPLDERLQKLIARAAQRWGGAEFRTASDELAAGDAAYSRREYDAAVEHFGRIEPLLDVLEQRAGETLRQQLAAGSDALLDGRSQDATAAFELALKIEPENAAAAQGLKRASVLDEVLRLLADAQRLEKAGDANGALAQFRQALALDAQTTRASQGIARIEAQQAADAFASAMARGYTALAKADYAGARSAFEAARTIRPQAPEIGQALRQIEQEQRTETIAAKLEHAQALEARERWGEALQEYEAILKLDSTIAAAGEGVDRAGPRARLHEQLELYLTQPERLFSQPVRAAAHEALVQAKRIANPGPVLQKQTARLEEWVTRAGQPVQVALQSDNLTRVTIYRVGDLGAFAERSLALAPGTYTIVGTRPGYRDVRRQISVAPGAALEPVVIRCEDRI